MRCIAIQCKISLSFNEKNKFKFVNRDETNWIPWSDMILFALSAFIHIFRSHKRITPTPTTKVCIFLGMELMKQDKMFRECLSPTHIFFFGGKRKITETKGGIFHRWSWCNSQIVCSGDFHVALSHWATHGKALTACDKKHALAEY